MNKLMIAAGLALLALSSACAPSDPVAIPVTGSDRPSLETAFAPPPAPAPAPADPYRTTGTWLVPSEIAPGSYRVTLSGSTGYFQICGDLACKIGTPGFIDNDFLQGPGVMVVPPTAVTVELRGVILTPIER